jgi:hypothetical protein
LSCALFDSKKTPINRLQNRQKSIKQADTRNVSKCTRLLNFSTAITYVVTQLKINEDELGEKINSWIFNNLERVFTVIRLLTRRDSEYRAVELIVSLLENSDHL